MRISSIAPGRGHRAVVVVACRSRWRCPCAPTARPSCSSATRCAWKDVAAAGRSAAEAAERLHQRLGPLVVVARRAGGDPVELVAAVVAAVRGVLPGQIGVILGAHVAAAAPGLVADAPERHPPRLRRGRWPCAARAIGLSPSRVRYSTHSLISCDGAAADVAAMYGSAPSSSHRSMNSWVPKWLFSSTSPQCVLTMRGRWSRGPMPSRQWYSSAKQPPGQRRFGMFSARSASTTSSRMPRLVGDRRVLARPRSRRRCSGRGARRSARTGAG